MKMQPMEQNCVFVVGVPGAGKTTSVNKFKKMFNRNVRATFKLIKQKEGQQHAQWEVNKDVTILRTDRVRAGVSIPLIKGMLEKSDAKLLIVEGCVHVVSLFNRGFLKYMVEDTDFKVWS